MSERGADDSQLVQPPYLHKLGIAYNTALPGLICLSCGIAVTPSHLFQHLKRNHKGGVSIDKQLLNSDIQLLGVNDDLPALDCLAVRPEIQGLLLHAGLRCSVCNKIYGVQSSIIKHHHEKHHDLPVPRSWTTVDAQQLDHTLHRSFFPVTPASPANVHPTQALIDDLRAAMEASDASSRPADYCLDPRLVSPWLKSNRWLDLIKDRSLEELQGMVAILKKDEFPGLVPAVHQLFLGSEHVFELVPELILQRLNTPDPAKT